MRTNIDIDDDLMDRVLQSGMYRTKKEAVEAGLRLITQVQAQQSIRELKGKLVWEGDLSKSRTDR